MRVRVWEYKRESRSFKCISMVNERNSLSNSHTLWLSIIECKLSVEMVKGIKKGIYIYKDTYSLSNLFKITVN